MRFLINWRENVKNWNFSFTRSSSAVSVVDLFIQFGLCPKSALRPPKIIRILLPNWISYFGKVNNATELTDSPCPFASCRFCRLATCSQETRGHVRVYKSPCLTLYSTRCTRRTGTDSCIDPHLIVIPSSCWINLSPFLLIFCNGNEVYEGKGKSFF